MGNIIWNKHDGYFALTAVADGVNASQHSSMLLSSGGIPEGWTVEGVNIENINQYNFSPIQTPISISPKQGKLALVAAGYYTQLESYIATLSGDAKTKAEIYWRDSTEWRRDDMFLLGMAKGLLGLTDDQIDQLFIDGALL